MGLAQQVRNFIREQTRFDHGGSLHQDELLNDLLVTYPHISVDIPVKYSLNQRIFMIIGKVLYRGKMI